MNTNAIETNTPEELVDKSLKVLSLTDLLRVVRWSIELNNNTLSESYFRKMECIILDRLEENGLTKHD